MYNTGMFDLDVEDELLLCLSRTFQNDRTVNRIKRLHRQRIDWPNLVQRATKHRVTPLLYHSLKRTWPGFAPSNVLQELEYHYGTIVRRNLFLTAELNKIIEFFAEEGITAIPYKGPTMALLAYNNLCLRQFGDLDILVDPRSYSLTRNILLTRGYRLNVDWGWECSLVDDNRGICVDLHRGITPEQIPMHLDFQRLQNRLDPVAIANRKINTLCAEDMLVILSVQLVKDGWGRNALRLSKVCDIAELLRTRQYMNWKLVFQEAGRLGCSRMVLLSLTVAHELLDAPLPESVICRAHAEPQLSALSDYTHHKLFHHGDNHHISPLSTTNFHFRVRERWRDKLFPYYRDFRLHITPNERDRALLPLPVILNFLYYFIRPFRLAKDYGILLFKMLWVKCTLRKD